MKRRAWHGYALLAVLVLPLFFICVRSTHDWGDDFAQYIIQARDLSHDGMALPDRAVLNWPAHGPAPKGIGFAVLLVPAQAMFGTRVAPYLVVNVLVVMAIVLLFFHHLRRAHGSAAACIGALLFVYDRHVLQACTEIMPDLLLTLCVVLLMVFLDKPDRKRWWGAVVVVMCAVLLKSAGWVQWLVLCAELVRQRWRNTDQRPQVAVVVVGMVLPVTVGVLAPTLLSRSMAGSAFWYTELFDAGGLLHRMGTNALVYAGEAARYFEQELPMWMNHIIVPLVLATAAFGFIRRVARRFGAMELLVVLWILMLLVYPDINSAARFMLPLLPIMLLYLIEGTAWLIGRVKLPRVTVPIMLSAFLLAHTLSVRWFAQHDKTAAMGPYAPAALEAFGAVQRFVPADSRIASTRPWAVHLFTGRTSMWALSPTDPGRPVAHVADVQPQFTLVAWSPCEAGMYDAGYAMAVLEDPEWSPVWHNAAFVLLERR